MVVSQYESSSAITFWDGTEINDVLRFFAIIKTLKSVVNLNYPSPEYQFTG